MPLERCYICGWKHPIDIEIPDYIEPGYMMHEILSKVRDKMHSYHDERLFGTLISNWLTYECGEDFGGF